MEEGYSALTVIFHAHSVKEHPLIAVLLVMLPSFLIKIRVPVSAMIHSNKSG